MPSYLVETYLARERLEERSALDRHVTHASEQLTREGRPVRLQRSLHLPDDEVCFFVLDAPSGRDAALAAERAGLDPIRVVHALCADVAPTRPEEDR